MILLGFNTVYDRGVVWLGKIKKDLQLNLDFNTNGLWPYLYLSLFDLKIFDPFHQV